VLPPALVDIRPLLQQFAELSQRYHAYWPIGLRAVCIPGVSESRARTLPRAHSRLGGGRRSRDPAAAARGSGARELGAWRRVLAAMANSNIDLARTVDAGPRVRVRLFVFPPDSEPAFPAGLLIRQFVAGGSMHALAIGTRRNCSRSPRDHRAQGASA
jgi:hypothetical protein